MRKTELLDQIRALAETLLHRAIRDEETCWCGHVESCDRPIRGVWLLPMDDGSYDGAVWLLCSECGADCTGTPAARPIATAEAHP